MNREGSYWDYFINCPVDYWAMAGLASVICGPGFYYMLYEAAKVPIKRFAQIDLPEYPIISTPVILASMAGCEIALVATLALVDKIFHKPVRGIYRNDISQSGSR